MSSSSYAGHMGDPKENASVEPMTREEGLALRGIGWGDGEEDDLLIWGADPILVALLTSWSRRGPGG